MKGRSVHVCSGCVLYCAQKETHIFNVAISNELKHAPYSVKQLYENQTESASHLLAAHMTHVSSKNKFSCCGVCHVETVAQSENHGMCCEQSAHGHGNFRYKSHVM